MGKGLFLMIPRSGALERLLAGNDERVAENCRTRLLAHAEPCARAVLLFHGLTASPAQFRRYADALYERGCNVLVPLFPLHGYADRLTGALADLTCEALQRFARESLDAARDLGEHVTVAGFSAGGTLALWLAQHETFDRAVAIAPFLGSTGIPRAVMRLAATAMARFPNRFIWWDPVRRERQMPAHGYPRYATHAVAELYALALAVMNDDHVPSAREIALVLNCGEASVNNGEIRALGRRWRAVGANVEQRELRRMPPSHDVIEPDRNRRLSDRVFLDVLDAIDPEPARAAK
jgi:pimeloyl-ACP methyl ester carboxylesterase